MFYVRELIDGEIKMFFSIIDVNHMLKYVLANMKISMYRFSFNI